MLDIYCEKCRSRMIVSNSRIRGIRNSPEGILVAFECWDGHTGVMVGGRPRTDTAGETESAPAAVARQRRDRLRVVA